MSLDSSPYRCFPLVGGRIVGAIIMAMAITMALGCGSGLDETDGMPAPSEAPAKSSGFAAGAPESAAPADICVTGPNKALTPISNVYYGTKTPTHLPLTPGQIMAIGTFWGCSGLLITPTWVLTADHCGLSGSAKFCMGPDPSNPKVCIGAKQVRSHAWADLTLMELTTDARTLLPGVEPISLFTESLGSAWIGKIAEAAGYGQQETGYSGTREFTAEPIVQLTSSIVTINGEGKHGVCFGDSGGPLMVVASDGSVRVAGALSNGDNSCVGWDNYTRVDPFLDWIEGYTGPTIPPGPVACGEVDHAGSCGAAQASAKWCGADGVLEVAHCAAGDRCSWSAAEAGWRCVAPENDACQGLTTWGTCDGNNLTWCGVGGLLTRDCGACGETCVPNETWGYYCVSSTCGDLSFSGECQGDVARWCNRSGQIESRNCADYDQGCAWLNEDSGFYCVPGSTPVGNCGTMTYEGQCAGNTAEWCDGGALKSKDCAQQGQICGWTGAEKGNYCMDAPPQPGAPESPGGCDALGYEGQCKDVVAEWCEGGLKYTRDCAQYGESCGWAGPEKGYYCVSAACGELDFAGTCEGTVAKWCGDGGISTRDCADYGQSCGWHSQEKGYYCLD